MVCRRRSFLQSADEGRAWSTFGALSFRGTRALAHPLQAAVGPSDENNEHCVPSRHIVKVKVARLDCSLEFYERAKEASLPLVAFN